jgi:hypothetical protein
MKKGHQVAPDAVEAPVGIEPTNGGVVLWDVFVRSNARLRKLTLWAYGFNGAGQCVLDSTKRCI